MTGRVEGKVCVVTGAAAGLDVTPGPGLWRVDIRDETAVAQAMRRVVAECSR